MGKGRDARYLALHLMALLQGAALLANIYKDKGFIKKEVKNTKDWIRSLV